MTTDYEPLKTMERNYILSCLAFHHGNRTQTVKKLQIGIRTLQRKLARYKAQGFNIYERNSGRSPKAA